MNFFASMMLASVGVCQLHTSEYMLEYTRSLILKPAPFIIPITENPVGLGRKECVVFDFKINKMGRAVNIKAISDSGNYIMNLSARRALENYIFKYEGDPSMVYSMIFKGRVGGFPAPPFSSGN